MDMQARLNLWQPRWTADPPAVDKTQQHGPRRVMTSHPTRGTMWIVTGDVDKGRSLKRKSQVKECFWSVLFIDFLFPFFLGPVDQQRDSRPAAPFSALTNHQLCYYHVFFALPFLTFWRLCFSVTCLKSPHRSLVHGWVLTCVPAGSHSLDSGQYMDLLRGKIIHMLDKCSPFTNTMFGTQRETLISKWVMT